MQVEIGVTRPYESEIDAGAASAQIHTVDTITQLSVELCGAFLILRRWRRVLHALRVAWPVITLAALAMLSTAWSDQPLLTLRRSALLLISTLFATYLGERYTLEKQAELLAHVFCCMMAAICILYFVAPRYVIDYVSHPGAWKGLSAFKNAFGQYMGIALILLLLVKFRRFEWMRYLFIVLAALLLHLAQSAASLFCCLLVIAVMPLWRLVRVTKKQKPAIYTAAATLLLGGTYLFTMHSARVFYLLGRNSSLSGRTDLWAAAWAAILRHPLLGYGFDTFWASLGGEALDTRVAAGWMAQRSDNGFLDLGLGLGMLGTLLFLFLFAVAFRGAIVYLGSKRQPIGLWPITYLCFFLIHNMSESTLITRGDFPTLLFVMITTSLTVMQRSQTRGELLLADRRNAYSTSLPALSFVE